MSRYTALLDANVRTPHSVSLAADDAWAGAQLHRSLIWPD